MTWGNPPKFKSYPPKKGKIITPEDLAKSGTEDGHQAAVFCWAAMNVGTYPQLAYMFAIPNGGQRHIVEATKMVATGLREGVCDILLPYPKAKFNYEYHGCFIEMKIEKYRNHKDGGCSEAQIDFIEFAVNAGYYCKVCYSWEEARDILISYMEGKL